MQNIEDLREVSSNDKSTVKFDMPWLLNRMDKSCRYIELWRKGVVVWSIGSSGLLATPAVILFAWRCLLVSLWGVIQCQFADIFAAFPFGGQNLRKKSCREVNV